MNQLTETNAAHLAHHGWRRVGPVLKGRAVLFSMGPRRAVAHKGGCAFAGSAGKALVLAAPYA